MTILLQKAFNKASKLPAQNKDLLAQELLENIESELRWQTGFETLQEKIENFAKEALREYRSGNTKKMGFDEL